MKVLSSLMFVLLFWACQNDTAKEETKAADVDRAQEVQIKVVDHTVEEKVKTAEEIEEDLVPKPPVTAKEKGVIKGYYSYFAEVGYFNNCLDNHNYLVHLSRSTVNMESDYLRLMKDTNEKIFAKIKGRIENIGKEKTLIVEEYLGFFPEESCD